MTEKFRNNPELFNELKQFITNLSLANQMWTFPEFKQPHKPLLSGNKSLCFPDPKYYMIGINFERKVEKDAEIVYSEIETAHTNTNTHIESAHVIEEVAKSNISDGRFAISANSISSVNRPVLRETPTSMASVSHNLKKSYMGHPKINVMGGGSFSNSTYNKFVTPKAAAHCKKKSKVSITKPSHSKNQSMLKKYLVGKKKLNYSSHNKPKDTK